MAGISGVTNFGASALHTLQQLSARTASLVDRVSQPDSLENLGDFAQAVVDLGEVRLQTRATLAVLHTTNSLADELLSRPRR